MNLNYELPAWAEEKLPPVSEEKRYYSVRMILGRMEPGYRIPILS